MYVLSYSAVWQAGEYWRAKKAYGVHELYTANVDNFIYKDLDVTYTDDHAKFIELIRAIPRAKEWHSFHGLHFQEATISMQEDGGVARTRNNETRLLKILLDDVCIVDFSYTGDSEHIKGHLAKDNAIVDLQCAGKRFRIPVETLQSLKEGLTLAASNCEQTCKRREKCRRKLEEIAGWDERTVCLYLLISNAVLPYLLDPDTR